MLAGRRGGTVDPLAAQFGVTDKCLAPLEGEVLIVHVLKALHATDLVGQIAISINDPGVLAGIPMITTLIDAGKLRIVRSRPNLADSVLDAAQGASFPLLITTADNVLLTPDAIAEMCAQAGASQVDAAVAFARQADVLAAHPSGQFRFYRFSDEGYSNCNTYWVSSAKALGAANAFRGGGQFAKHPLRIASAFGLLNLIRFRFGIGTLAGAFANFSKRFGLTIKPVIFSDGAIAIDVDNARTGLPANC